MVQPPPPLHLARTRLRSRALGQGERPTVLGGSQAQSGWEAVTGVRDLPAVHSPRQGGRDLGLAHGGGWNLARGPQCCVQPPGSKAGLSASLCLGLCLRRRGKREIWAEEQEGILHGKSSLTRAGGREGGGLCSRGWPGTRLRCSAAGFRSGNLEKSELTGVPLGMCRVVSHQCLRCGEGEGLWTEIWASLLAGLSPNTFFQDSPCESFAALSCPRSAQRELPTLLLGLPLPCPPASVQST